MNFKENLLNCSICKKLVNTPVVLPCGHNICNQHQIEAIGIKHELTCLCCHASHLIPESGFPVNLVVEQLLKMQLDQIDMGEEHKNASKSIQELESVTETLKKLKENPENEIYETISALKNQVDLDREVLKNKIDEEADRLIKELDEYEKECKSNQGSC